MAEGMVKTIRTREELLEQLTYIIMTTDDYSEVTNSEETYSEIANLLESGAAAFIGWTDGEGSHFDILFIYRVMGFDTHQGGVRPIDLFVSIMRVGSFGFEVEHSDTDWGYYDEKLGSAFKFGETTGKKLAELINGIKKKLNTE